MNIKNSVKNNLFQLSWEIKEQANYHEKKNILKTNVWYFVMKKYQTLQKKSPKMSEMLWFKIWHTNICMKKNHIPNNKPLKSLKKPGYQLNKMSKKSLKTKKRLFNKYFN